MNTDVTRQARTYGNWRRPRTAGLGGLGLGASVLLLCGLVAVVLATLISLWVAVAVGGGLVVLFVPLAVKDRDGRTLLTRTAGRLGWRRAVAHGSHLYRSGPLGRTGHGTCALPGLAAAAVLEEAQDAYGRPFALLSYPMTGTHVVVISCEADGASLVDQTQLDTWVAHWGLWLSGLTNEPGLVGASVTVETSPDSGVRLQQEVRDNLRQEAPRLARQMLGEVLAAYPAGSASITTRVALTYSSAPRGGRERLSAQDMAILLGNRLPGLTAGLAMTGAGSAKPMTAVELAEAVRVAYDPAVASLIEEARAAGGTGLRWPDAGPSGTQEGWDFYQHDSGYSVTWQMTEAPRGEVLSSVLTGLLQPSESIARKRVTLLYRPHDSASAAKIVERDRLDAMLRAQQGKVAKARDDVDMLAAEQTALEEAGGAGVVRFALAVTATVTRREDLPKATAAVEHLAPQARLRLRPVNGAQASAFASALPIGLVLPESLMVPSFVRESL